MNIKLAIIFFILLIKVSAQNYEQARSFINRSHISIMKVEKEMYIKNDSSNADEIKKSVGYQMMAINLFKQNKFKESVIYSFKSRSVCISLCDKMNISEGKYYVPDEYEKSFFNSSSSGKELNNSLTQSQIDEINRLNVMDPYKFQRLELNIK
jgi:hypothetical protein